MKQKREKKFFPGFIAQIYLRVPTRYDTSSMFRREHFDTWGEAHAFMVKRAAERVDHAERELKRAKNHQMRVLAMKAPNQ